MDTKKVVIQLERGDVLPLDNARDARIACLEGTLWITQEGDRTDIILAKGQTRTLERKGRALLQAMSTARIAVEAPGTRPQLGFAAFPRLRNAA
jgi:hypothetical protein